LIIAAAAAYADSSPLSPLRRTPLPPFAEFRGISPPLRHAACRLTLAAFRFYLLPVSI